MRGLGAGDFNAWESRGDFNVLDISMYRRRYPRILSLASAFPTYINKMKFCT